MLDGRPESGLAGMGIDEAALEVRRVRAEARRRLFGDGASITRVGRYELVRILGAGAMGTVYLARDPQLDRTVALKLLHPTRDSAATDRGSRRLLREARALAQIEDPRVATILDVGELDGRVFLAMELVEGTDLEAWLAGMPPWMAILETFIEAGLGLTAAHDAGVIHRDFKPQNVLRTPRGRVVVVDFGLAAAVHGHTDAVEGGGRGLTEAGRPLGTPAFMAPEQHRGVADAHSDQFAFCVALRDAVSGGGFPSAIRRRILRIANRGLHPNPEQRWPDMHVLTDALGRGRRRHPALLAAALVCAVGLVLVWPNSEPPPRCQWVPAPLGEVVDGLDVRARQTLSDYTQRLRAAYETACEDRSAELICLRRLRLELEAIIPSLPELPTQAVMPVIAGLGSPSECARRPGADQSPQARTLTRRLAEASARYRVGDLEGAEAIAIEVTRRSLQEEEMGVQSDAWLLRAEVAEERSNDDQAASFAEQAMHLALEIDDHRRLAHAAVQLAFLHATNLGEPDEAHRWSRVARASAERIGMPPRLSIDLEQLDGVVALSRGEFTGAAAHFDRALEDGRRLHGPDHYDLAPILTNIGVASYSMSDFTRAKGAWLAAARIYERTLGERHPEVASALSNLAIALMALRDYDLAIETHRRALAIRQEAIEADSPKIADSHHNLGVVLYVAGRNDEAKTRLDAALSLREAAYGADHPVLASSHAALGNLALREQRWTDARRHHQRAIDLWTGSRSTQHPDVLRSQARMAEADLALGEVTSALASVEGVLDAWLPVLGPTHQDVLAARTMRAHCLLELGRADEARADLERALVEIAAARVEVDPHALAELQFALVRALYRDPAQRRRATTMAEELHDSLAEAGEDEPIDVRERLGNWLRTPGR